MNRQHVEGVPVTFGQRLRASREASGLTQQELAAQLGRAQTAVSYWEGDKREPSIGSLAAMADLLGVDLNWLLGVERPDDDERFEAGRRFERQRVLSLIQRDAVDLSGERGSLWVDGRITPHWMGL